MLFEEWVLSLEEEPVKEAQQTVEDEKRTWETVQQNLSNLLGVSVTFPEDAGVYPWDSRVSYTTKDGVDVSVKGGPKQIVLVIEDSDDYEVGKYFAVKDGFDNKLEIKEAYLAIVEYRKNKEAQKEMIANAPVCACNGLYQFVGKESVLTVEVEGFNVSLTISMFNGNAITFELSVYNYDMEDVLHALLRQEPWRKQDYLINSYMTGKIGYDLMLTRYQSGADDEPMRSVRWSAQQTDDAFIRLFALLSSLDSYYFSLNRWADDFVDEFEVTRERALCTLSF